MNIPIISADIIGLPEWGKRLLHDKDYQPKLCHVVDEENGINFYIPMDQWHFFEHSLSEDTLLRLHDEEGNLLSIESSISFLKSFSNGFIEGFQRFDVSDVLNCEGSKKRRIMQIVSLSSRGFSHIMDMKRDIHYITLESSYESGINTGIWYHALSLIINNYELFDKFYSKFNKQSPPKKIKPFPEYLVFRSNDDVADKQGMLAEYLMPLLQGGGGKDVACIIQALKRLHVLTPYCFGVGHKACQISVKTTTG